jgi:hypothetical protein
MENSIAFFSYYLKKQSRWPTMNSGSSEKGVVMESRCSGHSYVDSLIRDYNGKGKEKKNSQDDRKWIAVAQKKEWQWKADARVTATLPNLRTRLVEPTDMHSAGYNERTRSHTKSWKFPLSGSYSISFSSS